MQQTERITISNFSHFTDACAAGSYSPDGLPPCSPCPTGSYQDTFGQTSCRECPGSQTTELEGATAASHCQGSTLLISGSLTLDHVESEVKSVYLEYSSIPNIVKYVQRFGLHIHNK